MSISPGKDRKRPRSIDKTFRGSNPGKSAKARAFGIGIVAMRRAARIGWGSVIRIDGRRLAIVPLDGRPRLERALEQEEEAKEAELDRLDVEEAERRLADPNDLAIPYEQVRRELGLADLPG